jgi:Ca2+-binding EF-hand superfamily protein
MRHQTREGKVAICLNAGGVIFFAPTCDGNPLSARIKSNCPGKPRAVKIKTENTMYRETLTAVAIIAGLVASTAQAENHARDEGKRAEWMQARFVQMDTNGDGQLAVDELVTQATARFNAADADGNGALTLEEMRAARAEGGKARMPREGNADKSEKPANPERGARMERMFERIDADSSGDVTLAEMQARRDPSAMVAKLDTDANGTLSLDEFSKARGHGKKGHDRPAD